MESLVITFSFHTFCSVKIWMSNKEDLQKSVEVYTSSFSLLKQVTFFNFFSVFSNLSYTLLRNKIENGL